MSEFGAQLKQARESRGISLRQVATSTKISTVALEALERGDLSKLPGGIFSRAFVKAYALEVGLDPDEVIAQFLVELGEHDSRRNKDEARPEVTADDRAFLEQQRRAAVALRIGVVVLVLLIIGAVFTWRLWFGAPAEPVVAPAPQASNAPAPVPVPPPAVVQEPATPVTPASSSPLWIELETSDSCWVQVTTDGTLIPARVMVSGDRQRFEAMKEIVLQVGNAGVVSLTVNGRPGRSLGRVGDVRTVTISSANVSEFFQDAPPTPNASGTGRP